MTDYALRISAAAGDPMALLALAIELNAALTGSEATIKEMRAAEQDRKEKQAKRTRRFRNVTERDATLQAVTKRDETVPPSPLPSSSFPTPHITPSFPPSPQPPPTTDEKRLFDLAPIASEIITGFLDGMPFARRLGWVTVLLWVMDEGPRLSPSELHRAVGDFCAKVDKDRWTPTYFRGFCRSVREPEGKINGAASTGDPFLDGLKQYALDHPE